MRRRVRDALYSASVSAADFLGPGGMMHVQDGTAISLRNQDANPSATRC
jgi:hypothetical protein